MENEVGKILTRVNKGLRPDQSICTKAKMALVDALVGSIENAKQLKAILSNID